MRRVKLFSTTLLHVVTVLMGAASFLAALRSVSTDEQPSGEAALWAPVISFCVALLFLFQLFDLGGSRWRKTRGLSIAFGSVMSAMLWIAAGTGSHPTDLKLWSDFGVVWVLAFVVATVLTILLLAIMAPEGDDDEKAV